MIKKKYIAVMALMASITGWLNADLASWNNTDQNCCAPTVCCEESSGSFFARGDYLYWKSHVSGVELDYGTTYIAQTFVDGVQVIDTYELDVDPHFKWESGYRIAAGYQFAPNGFEAGVFWTHFQDTGSRKDREDADSFDIGKYRVKFDQIDLVFAYNSYINPSFLLKPFIGVRGAEIHDHINTHLITDIALSPTVLATETRSFADHQKFWGVGPLVGIQGDWNVTGGFGIYGTAAASLLYSKSKVHLHDFTVFTAPISRQIFNVNDRDLHDFICNIDLALGVSWETCLFDSVHLSMKLGFEHHQYFNQNHLSANRGDLSFDGGIFSIGIRM